MPDKDGRFDAEERRAHVAPRCPICGGRTIQYWREVTDPLTPPDERRWVPAEYVCMYPDRHR